MKQMSLHNQSALSLRTQKKTKNLTFSRQVVFPKVISIQKLLNLSLYSNTVNTQINKQK